MVGIILVGNNRDYFHLYRDQCWDVYTLINLQSMCSHTWKWFSSSTVLVIRRYSVIAASLWRKGKRKSADVDFGTGSVGWTFWSDQTPLTLPEIVNFYSGSKPLPVSTTTTTYPSDARGPYRGLSFLRWVTPEILSPNCSWKLRWT